ncbi:MAG: M20/M25/M40 family metallo-hydrolase [Actinobacteria bacterium]|nr:M20/M25/M40 family metallo-hydrolase [Actinomycetota bacterium]MDI6829790.1 M20/M25/M40 family metallo-hydrolase [Actinomycetota bacterium]
MERALKTFLELAAIDSETYHEGELAAYVMRTAREAGFEPYMDNAGKAVGGEAGNLYINLPSRGVEAPPVIFCAHMDTVSPGKGVRPVLKEERVISGGNTILGADCKAGVAAILELMLLSAEGRLRHGPLELVLTVAEEKQLQGVRHLEWERLKSRHAFVLDGEGGVGSIINASPTQDNLEFVFHGRAAHAGVEPEKGKNAIFGAAWAISLMRLGRLDSETTANIGIIRGGRAVNIVPDRVVAEGEVRSHDLGKLDEQRKSMVRAALEAEGAVGVGVEVKVERAYDGYRIDADDPLVLLAKEAGKAMGMRMELRPSGGGSDANFLNAAGIRALVLGMGAREPHTTHEYLETRDLSRLVRLCSEIAAAAGRLRTA